MTDYPFNNDSSLAERKAVTDNDRKVRSTTFKDFASAFANEDRGGRFAKSSDDQTVKPIPSGPWSPSSPRPGDEPALGHDINAVPDLAVAQAPAPPLAVETASGGGANASSSSDAPSPSLNDDPPRAA